MSVKNGCACLLGFVLLAANAAVASWQQGFDFRNTATFVTDPPGATYVLPTTAYPTTFNGVTFGWVKTSPVRGRDRNASLDPRLAGINFAYNGSPATFYVDLPSPGTYNLSLALGDAGYQQCYAQCQIQFFDGNTLLFTLARGRTLAGYFYDAAGNNWSAAQWPTDNLSQQVTVAGMRLTVVVGLSQSNGDITPLAFLGVAQVSGSPNFTISASPSSLSIQQGNQGTSTITTTISGGFDSAISLSASGAPSGTTVSFSPNPIPAPGSGSSTMTIMVGGSTAPGIYPLTVTGNGGGVQQNTTVTLTVTGAPNFTISASPASLSIQQGNQGTSTITTTISGGFDSAITLSASGVPSGTTVSFNPNPIPAPGSGTSTMTVMVGGSTPPGTYPITVTGSGGGIQQNTTLDLTVTGASGSGEGFDFRSTASFVTDPPGATYVLSTTAYPTMVNGVTFGWVKTAPVRARDRNANLDPRLAGINFAYNGSPATFYVDLPSPGTYDLSLALGDAGYEQCWVQCQVQFLDGSTVLATIAEGLTLGGYFYDATGNNWSAAAWPTNNVSRQVTLAGTRLTVVVGTNTATEGDITPIVFLGVAQVSGMPSFTISASPASLSIQQGNQGTSTIATTISGGFDSAISLSASGVPSGTTVSFNPNPIPAPGSGSSTMTIMVGSGTAAGTYPITVTGNGGGIQQNTTVTLTVTQAGAAVDVLTYHYDPTRQGQNTSETLLTTSNVNSTSFGKTNFFTVNGKVDAQPLYVSGLFPDDALFVVGEDGSAYAFDAATGAQVWKVTTLLSGETTSDDHGCSQITPQIGITDTPVIDKQKGPNGAMYLVATSKDSGGKYHQRLHALDLKTGAALFGGPTEIKATYPGSGDGSQNGKVIFDPGQFAERVGLLEMNGNIYIAFTSHCDARPYTGWVMGYSATTLAQTSVIDVTPNGNEGAIWMAGTGLAGDANGNIYFLDGNGTFDTTLNAQGFPVNGDYGNGFIKLSTSGGLAVADYFNMYNTVQESDNDEDLGSGGAILLPDLMDNNHQVHHLAVGAGKDSNIYVVNRDNMGKFNPNNDNAIYQELDGVLPGGVWANPAYFNNTVYYGNVGRTLKAFPINNAMLASSPSSQSATNFGYPGALPAVSANGTANGIVWAVENSSPAVLHAYDATNLAHELYNSNQAGSRDQFGPGNKFITPVIVNGKVFVGTQTGVAEFGLLP